MIKLSRDAADMKVIYAFASLTALREFLVRLMGAERGQHEERLAIWIQQHRHLDLACSRPRVATAVVAVGHIKASARMRPLCGSDLISPLCLEFQHITTSVHLTVLQGSPLAKCVD